MTLFVSCFSKSKWCGWDTLPARFLVSCQRTSGVHERPTEGPIMGPFFIDKSLLSDKGLYKCKEMLYNVTVLYT